ncbi:hypothetical protein [Aquiflexum sp.]|uniref:hypothetical protein n=1 Tax=Aquiflexum sp. TaxID=1872584 RepID=UPI0035936291
MENQRNENDLLQGRSSERNQGLGESTSDRSRGLGERTSDRDYDQNERNSEKSQGLNKRVLTGMFRDRESAENAYNTLHDRGYSKDEINLLMSKDTRERDYKEEGAEKTEIGTKAAEHAGKGSAIGGTLGAIGGVIAAIGTSVVIPGLGILIAGPLVAGLVGAGAGGIAGGLIGALVGSGIPEARAKLYESGIKEGNVVITVTPKNEEDAKYLQDNWKSHSGEEIHY